MDCASKECFKKLDRIDKEIDYLDILDGLIKFSKDFQNEFVLEVLFVDTINNKETEINAIYKLLCTLNPSRVDIGTIDRPPAYDVNPISYNELQSIAYTMEGLNISIAHKTKTKLDKFLDKNELLNLLDKRPQTKEDIENLLNDESKIIFEDLVNNNFITTKNQAGVIFYGRNKSKKV